MSQTWISDVFVGTHTAEGDLANMEANFAALRSLFSGPSAPAYVAFQPWASTSTNVLHYVNAAVTAWIGLMNADMSQKVWLYLNAAISGWVVDSGVTDRVLAIRGGATYLSGGVSAGTASISMFGHNHQWIAKDVMNQEAFDAYGNQVPIVLRSHATGYGIALNIDGGALNLNNSYTGPAIILTSSFNPVAAVGTLQYLDL